MLYSDFPTGNFPQQEIMKYILLKSFKINYICMFDKFTIN